MVEPSRQFKIVTLGEGRVGKTSLLLRFVKNSFDEGQESTVNANFLTKDMTVDSRAGRFHIWDTAGQEKYRALARIYYRSAVGALIVYDITDRSSFDRVVAWVKELRSMGEDNIAIVIAGNKGDLESARQVPKHEANAYAKAVGAAHFSTSAKTGRGVEDAFQELARRIFQSQPAESPRNTIRRLDVVRTPSVKHSKCC